jgi:hypothetical protein
MTRELRDKKTMRHDECRLVLNEAAVLTGLLINGAAVSTSSVAYRQSRRKASLLLQAAHFTCGQPTSTAAAQSAENPRFAASTTLRRRDCSNRPELPPYLNWEGNATSAKYLQQVLFDDFATPAAWRNKRAARARFW